MRTFERVLRWGFVVLLAATAVTLFLILSGVFDPKPLGELVLERPLFPQIIAPQAPQLNWLEQPIPAGSYTIRLTVAQEESPGTDIGYGLVLGSDDAHVAVAVSPLGMLSVWQTNGAETEIILPWQTWPHVARNQEPNEIWLDVEDSGEVANGRLTIRINREFLWEGEIEPVSGRIGLLGESFGETAVVDFQTLQIFEE